jgi:hypothetical protein
VRLKERNREDRKPVRDSSSVNDRPTVYCLVSKLLRFPLWNYSAIVLKECKQIKKLKNAKKNF